MQAIKLSMYLVSNSKMSIALEKLSCDKLIKTQFRKQFSETLKQFNITPNAHYYTIIST